MTDTNISIEEAYDFAAKLCTSKNMNVSFKYGDVTLEMKPNRLGKKVHQLQEQIIALRKQLSDEIDYRHRESSKMRGDPTYWASGLYTFASQYKDRYYQIEILHGDVRLMIKHKDHNEILQRVPTI